MNLNHEINPKLLSSIILLIVSGTIFGLTWNHFISTTSSNQSAVLKSILNVKKFKKIPDSPVIFTPAGDMPPSTPQWRTEAWSFVAYINSISFQWYPSTDETGVTGYEIYRDGAKSAFRNYRLHFHLYPRNKNRIGGFEIDRTSFVIDVPPESTAQALRAYHRPRA